MTRTSVQDYVALVRPRYVKASRKERRRILDQFCRVTGYHRKSAMTMSNVSCSGVEVI
jgi:hypothetical protein